MRVIIDSNVLFSALIKDSVTRKIILNYENLFLFPEYIFREINNHKDELYKKSGMDKHEFNQLLQLILDKVLVVPQKSLSSYREEAKKLVRNIDINDICFIACALAYQAILWSDDKKLKAIKKIRILNTKEIIKHGLLV